MTAPAIIVPGAVVCPMRFTARAAQIIAFFELLGLHTASRQGSFAVLHGRGGRIAVHPLQTATNISETATSLVLEVPDARAAAERLAGSGLVTTWWGESFGRQAGVVSPVGHLSLNSELDDPYGHQVFDPAPSSVDVVATVFTPDLDAATRFFRAFGFGPASDATLHWRPLYATRSSGVLGLFPVAVRGDESDGPVTQIGLETSESLDAIHARLDRAGHPVSHVTNSGPPHLVVIDPDGVPLEIYPLEDSVQSVD